MTKAEVLLLQFARSNHTKFHSRGQKVEDCHSPTCREVMEALREVANSAQKRPRTHVRPDP